MKLILCAWLLFGSSGCVLWAFHERGKALERADEQAKVTAGNLQQCKARVATIARVPTTPPAARLDGTWQCMYTSPTGAQFAESLTFGVDGSRVMVTGRDNYNNNLMADGEIGGRVLAFKYRPSAAVQATVDGSGRMLDGQVVYWYEDGAMCHEARYRCRRRY